jgi:hypothetical protein
MVGDDYKHIAQCCHSLISRLEEDEFDRFIDRLIWAIHASPGGSPQFDQKLFIDRCKGKADLS